MTSAGFSGICMAVCTDKGQHAWTLLGSLESPDGQPDRVDYPNAPSLGGIAERRADECVWFDDHGRLNIRCPRCGRHIQWVEPTAKDKVGRLHAAGIHHLDISHLR